MLLDYQINIILYYLYKKIYSNHNRPPCTYIKFRCKESPSFWAGLLIISTDLFWYLGQLPIKLITDFKMSLSRSMKHDPVSVIIIFGIYFWFTKFIGVSLKDLWDFDAKVEIFTLVSVLFISCSAVSFDIFKSACWFPLNNCFLNAPPDELLLNLGLCLTGFPIVIIVPIPFLLTKNKTTTLRSI